jgi:hypothetical protein
LFHSVDRIFDFALLRKLPSPGVQNACINPNLLASNTWKSEGTFVDSEIDAKEIRLYAEDGHQIGTLDGAMDQLAHLARQQGRKDGDPVALQFTIEGKKVYLHTDNPEIPRMQLARVIGTYFRKLLAAGKKETKLTHTLRLLTNDQTYYVDSDHNVYKTSGVFTGHLQLQGEHAGTTIQSEFALGAQLADLQDIHQDRKDKPNEEAREMRF